jgi:hypothetical protein
MEEELQSFLKLIIPSATCLRYNAICIHLDVKERLEVSIKVNSSLEARQVIVIQPLVSNVKVELSNEKGVEVRGCRAANVEGSTIGFKGLGVKVEVVKKIPTFILKC